MGEVTKKAMKGMQCAPSKRLKFPVGTPLRNINAKVAEFLLPDKIAANEQNVPRVQMSPQWGFSCHSCTRCAGSKCGIMLCVPHTSSHKNLIYVLCNEHGGTSHKEVFEKYQRIYPDKDGYVGVIGFVEKADKTCELKSGTFNYNKYLNCPNLVKAYTRNYGSERFTVLSCC